MRGTIIGDIVGSRFEFNNLRTRNFQLFTNQNSFTDDTICTVAIMEALLSRSDDYRHYLLKWCRRYPNPMGSYGGSFARWINSPDPQPYYSFGNVAAMRVSPVAWAFDNVGDIITHAIATANVTHNHPEGIKGAIARAHTIAGLRATRERLFAKQMEYTYYDPSVQYQAGVFDETCQGTVPVALLIIQNSNSFEDAIREAMRRGGDSDTLGAIVGAMAEALYGVPEELWAEAEKYLPTEMREMVDEFYKTYVI